MGVQCDPGTEGVLAGVVIILGSIYTLQG